MSDSSVTERRVRPIQDAVAVGNFKQALKECEKWQKKGEKSDKFLALKALILANQPDTNQVAKGHTELLQLCKRNPAVTDVDAIHLLEGALKNLDIQTDEPPKLWERAAAARPADQGLLMTWLHGAVAESNWMGAQKAAMALRKAFPKDRHYEFWNILMYFLSSKDDTLPDKDRTLFGSLAYRLMSKAAEAVPTNPEQVSTPSKAVSTPEELSLLVQIYLDTGHASEAVDLLRGPSLGPESLFGQLDPQLVDTLLLEALEASKRWTDAFTVCKTLLEKSEHRGDDRIWNILYKAGLDPQIQNDYDELIANHTRKPELTDRLSQLTQLKSLRSPKDGNSVVDACTESLSICKDYYHSYSQKSFCFEDLKPSLEALDIMNQNEFRHFLTNEIPSQPPNNTLSQLFQLKYNRLTASLDENPKKIISRATSAITFYHTSVSSQSPCPEASLLAALDLLLLTPATTGLDFSPTSTHQTKPILRATLLLELSRKRFPDYYPTAILLIQCYTQLGLLSLAMETFQKLSIKNLQWESVGYLLLSRVSSLHPFASGKIAGSRNSKKPAEDDENEESLDPRAALRAGLNVLKRSEEALIQGVKEGLKKGSYSNILDAVRVQNQLRRSMNRWIYRLEESRVGRFGGEASSFSASPSSSGKSGGMEDDPRGKRVGLGKGDGKDREEKEEERDEGEEDEDVLTDIRDFSFLPNYISRDRKVYDMLRKGVEVKTPKWVDGMLAVEKVIAFLLSQQQQQSQQAQAGSKELQYALLKVSEVMGIATPKEKLREELTDVEFQVFEVAVWVWDVVKASITGTSAREEQKGDVPSLMKDIKTRLDSTISTPLHAQTMNIVGGINVPGRHYLHASFMAWELAYLLNAFLSWLKRQQQTQGQGQGKGKAKKASSATAAITASSTAVPKEDIQALKDSLVKLEEAITESARNLKKGLSEGGVLGELVDVVLAREGNEEEHEKGEEEEAGWKQWSEVMSDLIEDEAVVETLVGRWRESWDDALDGVLGVKIKLG